MALPPCLWGDDKGLEPSVLLPPNTELVSIKKNRNTIMGHYGEMARLLSVRAGTRTRGKLRESTSMKVIQMRVRG